MKRSIAVTMLTLVVSFMHGSIQAQERLRELPGQARFERMSRESANAIKPGAVNVTWVDGGKAFEFSRDGKSYRYDIPERKAVELKTARTEPSGRPGMGRRGTGPARGRQFDAAASPDGTLKAFYRDRNLFISDPNGLIEAAVTTDGSEARRIKNGKASWVYGEELFQGTAFWWSPDGKKLAYYRFDESRVADYYLALDQTKIQARLDAEPYPKAGSPNPVVDLLVYDLKSKKTTPIDVRDGRPFVDDVVGHYVYGISWSQDGKSLLLHRTNRHQNILELAAADPESGKCRVIVREEWPASWVENSPEMRFLKDGKRFLWASQRNGFKNYHLYDLEGHHLATVTDHDYEASRIVRVDEEAGVLDYLANDGDNPLKPQLHRVSLDGKGDHRLTDPAFHHTVDVAPDGQHLIDVAQTHDTPPSTRLLDADGKLVETIAESDLSRYESLGMKRAELLTFKAADGQTDLYGLLHRPSDFDPGVKYPLLVTVYAGPETNGARETFAPPNPLTEYGFLVASFDSRSAGGRGKKFLDAIYKKLGTVEIDDQAAGVKALRDRSYVDASRVGVFGTSYGGYASLLCLLRHPDVFQAACASSAVTDFRNYDTIYTERYLRTPQENREGYDAGNPVNLAASLKGRLMIYFGTADDNVHPSNSLQLIEALQTARKSFEVQVGPDRGHSSISRERMMEFFLENLKLGRP
jgi:dipeptidyl-peptidase-4